MWPTPAIDDAQSSFAKLSVTEVLRQLEADGERIAGLASAVPLPDADDLPFLEVALSGRADVLVIGNLRHFQGELGVDVLSPESATAAARG